MKLQSLLNHTAQRLLKSISNLEQYTDISTTLYCKWGYDGTSGFQMYKQITPGGSSDESMLVTAMVPLRLECDVNGQIVWENPVCSSTRYCRPIRLQYIKETINVIQAEEKYISEQINSISSFISDSGIVVNFKMDLTMIDGKV